MCIRDSHAENCIADEGGGYANDGRSVGTAVARTAGLAGACLLYTSDAADERSSVDLGGRRIIKKKKNRTQDDTHIMPSTKYKSTQKQPEIARETK